jgi:2-hydroxy-4-carboxymuconate semialdehyde hemiacetal dehydrogenase
MRLGIIGYGAVAAIHAKRLRRWGADPRIVCGPSRDKSAAFASSNGIPQSTTDLEGAFGECDAVIVASPSDCHYSQALAAVRAGRHCLVELPACSSACEAVDLSQSAAKADVVLQCAHTSRFLQGIIRVTGWLKAGALGDIHHLMSLRAIPPRSRSWLDDAVLHHAAHHIDLMLQWFGPLHPVACVAHPELQRSQDAVLAATLENGAPVNLSVSYTSRLRETRLTVVGVEHTVATDGFSVIESDNPAFRWRGDEQENYEAAIEAQDRAFLEACGGRGGGVPWEDTVRLAECLDRFLELGRC